MSMKPLPGLASFCIYVIAGTCCLLSIVVFVVACIDRGFLAGILVPVAIFLFFVAWEALAAVKP